MLMVVLSGGGPGRWRVPARYLLLVTTSKCPGAGKAHQGWEGAPMSSLPQNGVVAGSVLPLSEGSVGPCSQLCSMSAVGSGTPNSARMQVLSCGDAEGEGRSLTIGTGKSVLEQRDFLLSYTEKHANNTCSPSKQEGQGGTEEEGAAAGSWLCGHGDHVPWEPCACVVPSLSGELKKGQECLGSSIPPALAMGMCYVTCCHQVNHHALRGICSILWGHS